MSTEPRPRDTADNVLMAVGLAVGLGLLATVWWTTVQKSRRARREDLTAASNLRHLVQGAERHFTDHGVSSVTFNALVGTNPSQYVKTFATVAHETYSAVILQSTPVTASGISGARTVTYAP